MMTMRRKETAASLYRKKTGEKEERKAALIKHTLKGKVKKAHANKLRAPDKELSRNCCCC